MMQPARCEAMRSVPQPSVTNLAMGGLVDTTNDPLTILGIAGSLRRASLNRAALRAAQQLAPQGAQIGIFDLEGIPPFNQDA